MLRTTGLITLVFGFISLMIIKVIYGGSSYDSNTISSYLDDVNDVFSVDEVHADTPHGGGDGTGGGVGTSDTGGTAGGGVGTSDTGGGVGTCSGVL